MTRIAYTVTASFPDPATADEFVAWLEDGHVDAVIAGGAHSAMIVRLDPDPSAGPEASRPRVEVRYVFATREMFDRYVTHSAPALRAEGMKRFGPARGVSFARTTGTIV